MTVGERIRKIRKEKGLTQKKLSELSNINEVQIRQYELGKANPKIETLDKLAKALETTTNELRGIKTLTHFTPEVVTQNQYLNDMLSSAISDMFSKNTNIDLNNLNLTPDILAELCNELIHRVVIYDEDYNTVSIRSSAYSPNKLYDTYNMLNQKGKKEALKRIEELTEIERYVKEDSDEQEN